MDGEVGRDRPTSDDFFRPPEFVSPAYCVEIADDCAVGSCLSRASLLIEREFFPKMKAERRGFASWFPA